MLIWRTFMDRIYLFLTTCISFIIGASVTIFLGLHPACMLGTIISILALALSLEFYFKERREKEERLYAELMAKDNALNDFITEFGIDRKRAEILYRAGFKKVGDFKDKSIQDLMQIDDINPTVAKRIESRMKDYHHSTY